MNKTFRINLGSICECFKEDEMMELLYIITTLQRADPFTKPLQVAKMGRSFRAYGRSLIPVQKLFLKVVLAQNALSMQDAKTHRIRAFHANSKGDEEEVGVKHHLQL